MAILYNTSACFISYLESNPKEKYPNSNLHTCHIRIVGIIYICSKPSAAFYLLQTRAWEMLAGGLVFLPQQHFTKNSTQLKIYELLGFSCIVASIAVFDSQTLWPGWKALLPSIGTCLVIIGNQGHSILSATKLHTAFGKWSYSLYLRHWPLVVFLHYANEKDNNI
jgi:peptidoglycan/LPS O-acetylase OafA/YrhL